MLNKITKNRNHLLKKNLFINLFYQQQSYKEKMVNHLDYQPQSWWEKMMKYFIKKVKECHLSHLKIDFIYIYINLLFEK